MPLGSSVTKSQCCALAQTTFRRLLLNKCQEEFEEGDAAIKAVDAREKAAAAAEAQNVHAPFKLCCFNKCWICCVHKNALVCGLLEVLMLGLLASTEIAWVVAGLDRGQGGGEGGW